jgi:magnesium-transporting ATPase (P-type)
MWDSFIVLRVLIVCVEDERIAQFEELAFVPFDATIRRTEAIHKLKVPIDSGESDKKIDAKNEKFKIVRTMKGSVDMVASFCKLTDEETDEMRKMVETFSGDGCRTIAIAKYTQRTSDLGMKFIFDKSPMNVG